MTIREIAKQLVAPGKGILAADESNPTVGKRLTLVNLENTEENRQMFRNMLLSAEGIEKYLNGVILYDETFHQKALDGDLFRDKLERVGVMPGIKVDLGTIDFPGFPNEVLTQGLDGLPERLKDYADLGAKFTKWRAVIRIDADKGLPSPENIHLNSIILARYARLVQDAGMVPIVEPEVLLDGTHTLEKSRDTIKETLSTLFYQCTRFKVDLSGLVLKTSMALDGGDEGIDSSPEQVAEATVAALKSSVPKEVPGVAFLSGGQSALEATRNLNAIAKSNSLPWEVTFSFARALQQPALDAWQGKSENIPAAHEAFLGALEQNVMASAGQYE